MEKITKKITIKMFKCYKCGHEWIPRKKRGYPIACPCCKKNSWRKE